MSFMVYNKQYALFWPQSAHSLFPGNSRIWANKLQDLKKKYNGNTRNSLYISNTASDQEMCLKILDRKMLKSGKNSSIKGSRKRSRFDSLI